MEMEQIKNRREAWVKAKEGMDRHDKLLDEREELTRQIHRLKQQIDSTACAFHEKENPELEKILNERKEELKKLKKNRDDMDHELDLLESYTYEEIDQRYKELIAGIIQMYPEEKARYNNHAHKISHTEHLLKFVSPLLTNTRDMVELLRIVNEHKERVRLISLYHYIFGNNPNYVISRSFKNLSGLASKNQVLLQKIIDQNMDQNFRKIYEKELEYLNSLSGLCNQRWGFKILNAEIPHHLKMQLGFAAWLSERVDTLSQEKEKLKKDLDSWLLSF